MFVGHELTGICPGNISTNEPNHKKSMKMPMGHKIYENDP